MNQNKQGCEVFNVEQVTHWAFADGLGVNPKADLGEDLGNCELQYFKSERKFE